MNEWMKEGINDPVSKQHTVKLNFKAGWGGLAAPSREMLLLPNSAFDDCFLVLPISEAALRPL